MENPITIDMSKETNTEPEVFENMLKTANLKTIPSVVNDKMMDGFLSFAFVCMRYRACTQYFARAQCFDLPAVF